MEKARQCPIPTMRKKTMTREFSLNEVQITSIIQTSCNHG